MNTYLSLITQHFALAFMIIVGFVFIVAALAQDKLNRWVLLGWLLVPFIVFSCQCTQVDRMSLDFNDICLQLSVLIPFYASLMLIFGKRFGVCLSRFIAIVGFLSPLLIALRLTYHFDSAFTDLFGYRYYSNVLTEIGLGISLKLGLNGISLPLYMLAAIVGFAAGFYALIREVERPQLYWMLLLMMQAGLMGTFASIDIFFFYFFHELALIPTFIMILIWGGQGRYAISLELTIYLSLGALLSLFGLILLYVNLPIVSFDIASLRNYMGAVPMSDVFQNNVMGLLLLGFGILVSLFPFHSWAPRGYAAMPTSAAMLHAGVLKKFGLYGLIQVALPILWPTLQKWGEPLAYLALGNIVIIGLITMAQRDLKQMVSYSSVMHMGYCFLGIACMLMPASQFLGLGGAVMLMFAHGLSVALLFLLGTCVHERTQTFDMTSAGGLCKHAPVLAFFFVAATFANIGLPGFANFWGELSIFIALWQLNPWMLAVAATGIIISAVYGLRAVTNIFFGKPSDAFKQVSNKHRTKDLSFVERIPALLLLGALLWIGFWPQGLSRYINESLINIYVKAPMVAQSTTPVQK